MSNQPNVTRFFLGANSQHGFYSLYDQFATKECDTLHIIKSGPGTGKSTFMKRIGAAAEAHGLDVEYILCSGDPDSLDGVYIPALHAGWADGTAPHILEPKHFGIDGTYVDLGQFCSNVLLSEHRSKIIDATAAYRLSYQKAYTYLSAAGSLSYSGFQPSVTAEHRIRKRAQAKFKKELSFYRSGASQPVKRFISAISCKGRTILTQTISSLCERLCILESKYNLEEFFFDELISKAATHNIAYILCPNPLCPEYTEAVIFPDAKLCFIAAQSAPEFHGTSRTIHLDSYLEHMNKSENRRREKLYQQLLDAAYAHLSQAKKYHDVLESYYHPALDTNALNKYTEQTINALFS